MANDPLLTKKSVLGLAERVVMAPQVLNLHAGALNNTKTELPASVDAGSELSFAEYQQIPNGMVFSLIHSYYKGTVFNSAFYGIGIKVPNGFVGMLYNEGLNVEQKSVHFHFYRENGSAFRYIGL